MAPSLVWRRDIGDDLSNARNTFSSWDSCMTQAYCKWPAIVGIIIGSLIVISIIWCCARCLCCGVECCCGCFSCFNRCCPSPRRKNDGYQQAGPPQPYQQYQGPQQPMVYGGGGYAYRGPQTATFDASTKNGKFNEDALPAMPSWDTAQSKHVHDEDVEMEKLDQHTAQQQGLLAHDQGNNGGRYCNNDPTPYSHLQPQDTAGDLGAMNAGPYHDYDAHRQFAGSPTSTAPSSMYPPTYRTRPQDSIYEGQSYQQNYAPSIPPSYHTGAPSIVSPIQQHALPMGGMGRKPVHGSWRDV